MENMGFTWDFIWNFIWDFIWILYGIYIFILLIFHYHVDSLTYDFQWKRRVG